MQLDRQQAAQGGGLQRGDRQVEALGVPVDEHPSDPAGVVAHEPFDAGPEADVDAGFAGAVGDGEDEPLVAALHAAHRLAGAAAVAGGAHAVGARPQVGGGQLGVLPVEARVKQRAPDAPHDLGAAVAGEPAFQRLALQRAVVAAQLAVRNEPGEPRAAEPGQRGKAQEVADAVERVHLAVDEEADADGGEAELIGEPELVGERDHALVGGDDHVVEAVDAVPGEVHRAGEPAGGGGALEQRHPRAALGEAQGEDGAEDPGADDADRRPARALVAGRRSVGAVEHASGRRGAAHQRPPAMARS